MKKLMLDIPMGSTCTETMCSYGLASKSEFDRVFYCIVEYYLSKYGP